MIFKLLVTEEAYCSEMDVARLSNELQLFFSFEAPASRIQLPPSVRNNLLLRPKLLRESLSTQGTLQAKTTALRQIVLTSRQLSGNEKHSIFTDDEPPIVSNFFEHASESPTTL